MRKTEKVIMAILLSFLFVMLLGVAIPNEAKADVTDNDFYNTIASLQNIFKNGQYWNYYSSSDLSSTGTHACYCSGYCRGNCNCQCGQFYYNGINYGGQCHGYALKLGNLIFGGNPAAWGTHGNAYAIVAGDIVRASFTSAGIHTIFVYRVDGDTIYYTDCNFVGPCQVRWGGTYTKAQIANKASLTIWHASNNACTTGYQSNFILDVNGWLDNEEKYTVADYATFDVYVNGNKEADDVNDFCKTYSTGATYSITDIKAASGKAFDGFSNYALGGFVSGGRTGTLNSNTDVRMVLHTVDATAFCKNHNPSIISVFNGHTYYYYNDPVTWYDAELASEHLGGHLVSVTSDAENAFIKELIGDSACWIGLTDRNQEGNWQWLSGEAFSYNKWYGSSYGGTEPNNDPSGLEGTENYVHIRANSDTWNDNSGCTQYPFICEIDNAYTITYDANDGTSAPATQTKAVGQSITLSEEIPTRPGYTFLGWSSSSSATTITYHPGDTYATEADLTLYAVWESKTYTITYYDGSGTPIEITVEGGGEITLPIDTPLREGYDFFGWSTSPDDAEAMYRPGDAYPGGTVTLYAVWKIQQFTVTFDSAGAGDIMPITVDYGSTIPDLPLPERYGLAFRGWFTAENRKITSDSIITSALFLTAHWSEPTQMILPSDTEVIEGEAFAGNAANVICIPSKVTSIGSLAFANNDDLYSAIVYSRTVRPAADAFANCPNLTIYGYESTPIQVYANEQKIPFKPIAVSGWVLESEVPFGASLTGEEKWVYDHAITETVTSTEPTLEGWTEEPLQRRWEQTETGTNNYVEFGNVDFDTSHVLYGKYNRKMANAENTTEKTEVGNTTTNAGYIYYHWTLDGRYPQDAINAGHAINVYVESTRGSHPDGYTYTLFHAFEVNNILTPVYGATNSNAEANLTNEGIYSTCYVSGSYNLAQYVSYWWYITEIRQQTYTKYQRIFTYSRQTTEQLESATPVAEGDGISNVRHYVKYGFGEY